TWAASMPCARSSSRTPTPKSSCAARWASRRWWSRRFRRGRRISWSSRSNRRASSKLCSGSSADSMDLSQYAELFLAESREHLSACNQLLLDWERTPANSAPVGGLFRAVHTVKGMAATMGYGRVTDIAHRTENLLDLLRRGSRPATDELLQLVFRARDALEHAVELSVVGREDELDVAEVVADLESAAALLAGPERAVPAPPTATAVVAPAAPREGGGRLVQVTLRAEAPLKGGRALLALKRAQALGAVQGVTPPQAGFESDDFDGRFSFRLDSSAAAADIERAVRAAGDVEHVSVGGGGEERRAAAPRGGAAAAAAAEATPEKSRHIRVDLRRLDELMDLIGELVTVRGRLNELAAARRGGGKPPEGEIVLAAVRERASVAISVSDDGRGIDRARILERAKREGLVDPHAEALSDDQLLRVLARPGFSTAEAVTSVSGRGVGID